MKNTGITRPVDRLGRIVIPKEIRDDLNLKEKDRFFFLVSNTDGQKNIVLKQAQTSCALCNNIEDLQEFNNKLICPECIEKITNEM